MVKVKAICRNEKEYVKQTNNEIDKVMRGHKKCSSSKRCLPWAITRCVLAGRRSAPDFSSTLSVRRVDLGRFPRRVTRMYLLCSFALRVSHRTLTGM